MIQPGRENDPPMIRADNAQAALLSEGDTLDRFDSVWRGGDPPGIEDFLPAGGSERREVLLELIKIDLEYRWRRSQETLLSYDAGDDSPSRPTLDYYAEAFPELGSLRDWPLDLIGEEYRARRLWGDRPDHVAYADRFADRAAVGRAELERVAAELIAESRPASIDGTRGPQAGLAAVPCPHCRAACACGDGSGPRLVACPECGSRFRVEPTQGDGSEPPRPHSAVV